MSQEEAAQAAPLNFAAVRPFGERRGAYIFAGGGNQKEFSDMKKPLKLRGF